jgi:hypothetical protein
LLNTKAQYICISFEFLGTPKPTFNGIINTGEGLAALQYLQDVFWRQKIQESWVVGALFHVLRDEQGFFRSRVCQQVLDQDSLHADLLVL